ncbi:hypothetical protein HK104_011207 [Borealophlyctis nickersoniae]|nr:hypothetical protein HK104_011207 [Borealophlyctis nickersoniae]
MADKVAVCGILFWLKVVFAISVAFLGLGYQMVLIHQRREYALAHPNKWVPPPPPGYVDIPEFTADNATNCWYNATFDPELGRNLARLEPPGSKSFWFGFDLQWQVDSPAKVVERLGGVEPALYNTFINMNADSFEKDTIDWMAQQTSQKHGMLEITLIPSVNIEDIPDSTLWAFAVEMKRVNSYYGVPVWLRFMHEMNGNWITTYGQKPEKFKRGFRTMAYYIHTLTNLTAMVWSPNIGTGYPYVGGAVPLLEDMPSLDTDGNGVLDNGDDPYLPYYPGDEYVDWVGISLYNLAYSDSGPNKHQTLPVTPDFIPNQLHGQDLTHNFYDRFSVQLNKPFMMSETASFYAVYDSTSPNVTAGAVSQNPATAVADEIAIKQSWWRSILFNAIGEKHNTTFNPQEFRNWKLAVWFEERKVEQSYWSLQEYTDRDYHITFKPDTVTKAFLEDVSQDTLNFPVTWAKSYKWTCDGKMIPQKK